MDAEEPTIRNSNLLPVKANGDVLLRSVASLLNLGTVDTPVSSWLPSRLLVANRWICSCCCLALYSYGTNQLP